MDEDEELGPCEHWSASGTGAEGVWQCDSCDLVYRMVTGPDGFSREVPVAGPDVPTREGA